MSDIFLTMAAGVALAFFSFSVWASVEKMNIGSFGERSIYTAPDRSPIKLPQSDLRAKIPANLLQQLEPVTKTVKGEV